MIPSAIAEPPVVSRSTTVKVTDRSGSSSSSKLVWTKSVAGIGVAMIETLGRGYDGNAAARQRTVRTLVS